MSNNHRIYNLRSRNSTGALRRNSQANVRRQNVVNPPHLNAVGMSNGSGRLLRSSSRLRNNPPNTEAPENANQNAGELGGEQNHAIGGENREESIRNHRQELLEIFGEVPRNLENGLAPQRNDADEASRGFMLPQLALENYRRIIRGPTPSPRPHRVFLPSSSTDHLPQPPADSSTGSHSLPFIIRGDNRNNVGTVQARESSMFIQINNNLYNETGVIDIETENIQNEKVTSSTEDSEN